MSFFKKINVFTLLMAFCVFALVLRVVNIAQFPAPSSVAEDAPSKQAFTQVNEEPPPLEKLSEKLAAAEAKPAADAPAGTPSASPVAEAMPAPPSYGGEQGFSATEVEVLQSLAKRRDELNRREQKIGQREALLKAAEGEVDRKIAELNKIKGELEALLNKQKTSEDERITSLVKIYENMKPKEAARIFDTLEMDVLLAVIGKMSERKTSPVLANMNPDRARQVTIQLAEQRRLPGMPEAAVKADPVLMPPALNATP